MEVYEFLDRLYATPRTWRLTQKGQKIRAGSDQKPRCPWSIIPGDDVNVIHRGQRVNQSIWDAADNAPGHDPTIRAALLAACGLEG